MSSSRAALNILIARRTLLNNKPVTDYEAFLKQSNKIILDGINPLAGHYRNEDKIISGCFYTPPKPRDIKHAMKNLTSKLNEKISTFGDTELNNNGILLAAEMHCQLARLQPFDDGNKRTARLLTSHILQQTIGKDINFNDFNMNDYLKSTLYYYNTENIEPFYDFLKANVLHKNKEITLRTISDIYKEQEQFAAQMKDCDIEDSYDIH